MSLRFAIVGVASAIVFAAACVSLDGLNDPGSDAGPGGLADAPSGSATGDGAAAADAARDAAASLPPIEGDGGCATLVVNVTSDMATSPDREGIMAVLDGTPDVRFGTGDPLWLIEKAKTWIAIDNYFQITDPTQPKTVSKCVPAGEYTLQYWDIWGSGGSYDNGTPPANHYIWQIGKASKRVRAVGGTTVTVDLFPSQTGNVPTNGAFYGSWANWDYGPCGPSESCAIGTCFKGACLDKDEDTRFCGDTAGACGTLDCCGGHCTDTGQDTANCGSCNLPCGSGATCQASQCK